VLLFLSVVNLKPPRGKITYLLYATTIAGYFAGRTIFGGLSSDPEKPKKR
jgi:hypothetical protein